MSSLSSLEANLPAGFRFHPRDDELICDYLMNWPSGVGHQFPMLIKVDLNKCEPWDIPETACVGGKEWYFYSLRDRKYATGYRTNRATGTGYWKATGKDRPVSRKGTQVGMRKTLVFYEGRAPKGHKTDWVMHEFRVEAAAGGPGPKPESTAKDDWVLCRVFKKRPDISCKQEPPSNDFPAPPPPPPSMADPYTAFDSLAGQYHEQVPCFSINPGFSRFIPQQLLIPDHFEGGDFGMYGAPASALSTAAVLNRAEMETSSFGEGSSDSYLSEAALWSRY